MTQKLASILRDIEDGRAFTDNSYLNTSFFVIFMLFGCNDEQRDILTTKANRLIADRQAFAVIDVTDSMGSVDLVEKAIEKVADEHIDVQDLNEMHFCPVIVSEVADISSYHDVIAAVDAYMKNRNILPIWKTFLILDVLSDNAAQWLDTVSDSIRVLGSMHGCRCCVLTRKDEKGFGVAEERLLTTVLFVAFLHVVKQTREEIGRYIGVQRDKPDDMFYTAQSVFVENPVVTRIFNRMSGLLDRLCKHKSHGQSINMSFINDILRAAFEQMPNDRGFISLLPIYSVMPDNDLEDFKRRLKAFALRHYLSFAQDEQSRRAIFEQIASGFLSSCVQSGLGIEDLLSLIGNNDEINKLAEVQVQHVSIAELPYYPGAGKFGRDVPEIYKAFEHWLRRQILNIGSDLLRDYFQSDGFTALPKKHVSVQEKLGDVILEMNRIRNQRKKLDTTLPLLDDPDERWLDDVYAATTREFVGHFVQMALTDDDEAFNNECCVLLDKLYQASKELSGGSGARTYMKLVSDTCADASSDTAKSCVTTLGDALRYPVRISNRFVGEPDCTYVWGNMENNLYSVWEKYHAIIDTRSVELPIRSNERFAFLRVSSSFSRARILSIRE